MCIRDREAVQAALDLEAKLALSMHWGTFMLTDEPVLDPPKQLERELKRIGKETLFLTPKPGEIISLE